MKKIIANTIRIISMSIFVLGTTPAVFAAGPPVVTIGTACDFAIVAKTAVTTTGATSIGGDIALSPAAGAPPYLTGFSETMDSSNQFSTSIYAPGKKIYAASYTSPTPTMIATAVSDMEAAYTDASGRTPGTGLSNLNVGGGTLSGLTFVPGTYTWNTPGDVTITGDITISGSATDVWIFQISGTLNIDANIHVLLSGGALPENIFWAVAGSSTLQAGSIFEGVILDQTNIAMQNGSVLNGCALAQTAVTLIASTINGIAVGTHPVAPSTQSNGGTLISSGYIPQPAQQPSGFSSYTPPPIVAPIAPIIYMPSIIIPTFPKTGFAPVAESRLWCPLVR